VWSGEVLEVDDRSGETFPKEHSESALADQNAIFSDSLFGQFCVNWIL
jgi:hypothetical protein